MKAILLIEDDPIMGESLSQRLELEGYSVRWCRHLAEATVALNESLCAVVSDVRLPDGLASHWFVQQPAALRALPWFFLTGYGSVNDAVAAIRAGAREYLMKPFDIEALVRSVRAATSVEDGSTDDTILGVSTAMRHVESVLRKVAAQKVPVLLTGESGVGKEIAATLIHRLSPRGVQGEFVAVNCAAIPENLMEAEFFGHEKNAFTGAQRAHRGFLERANGGTLFLDEVGELPPSMQAKLLRALQEQSFFRLGAEKLTRSDFRIVAATNRDLHSRMASGHFREDLYYRLAVVKVHLPPLRERPEDIRWLTERMLSEIATEQGRPVAMSEAFLHQVLSRSWKGNARELRAFLEQSVVLSEAGILDLGPVNEEISVAATPTTGPLLPLQTMIEGAERAHIRLALERASHSIGKTAELLGISRKTLWEKMKRLQIAGGRDTEVIH
jgi:DNA-binding NtrC family response regulator